nr:immunoglobulin light chain junction region [Macaca mulatta]MOY09716.1 immunoglobulin light chain junction region [Macaca mulatta]MOY10263.1 immunoglobulin light chain junction region [Macaca mulatta]
DYYCLIFHNNFWVF